MFNSSLHDEKTFYRAFIEDLNRSQQEVIVESPFITSERMKQLYPTLGKLIRRDIKVYIITRDPKEHEPPYDNQSELEIQRFEKVGIQPLICKGNHHRKLAIIDRSILWEGSLNILSQTKSREIMRRIDDKQVALDMFNFLKLEKFL